MPIVKIASGCGEVNISEAVVKKLALYKHIKRDRNKRLCYDSLYYFFILSQNPLTLSKKLFVLG